MMIAQTPLDTRTLYALAPLNLPSYRENRFSGDAISVRLADFVTVDQQRIIHLYDTLLALDMIFDTPQRQYADLVDMLRAFAESFNLSAFMYSIQQLGDATVAAKRATPSVRRVTHDVKGGGLAAAMINLQMLLLNIDTLEGVTRLAYLVRDHLAIMQNCISDLADQKSSQSQREHAHYMTIIEQTWSQTLYTLPEGAARVTFDSSFDGVLASSETEFAALRRSLYNIINNAVRFSADGMVHVSVISLPNEEATDARFVVYNRLTPEHQQTLSDLYPMRISELFLGGFTTGGSGLGMRICAEFIAEDYGISVEQCINDKYIGATLLDDLFVAWFHWPAVAQREVGYM